VFIQATLKNLRPSGSKAVHCKRKKTPGNYEFNLMQAVFQAMRISIYLRFCFIQAAKY
jgi:hypothetical protein